VIARICVAACAVLVLAWLAIGERNLRLEASGIAASQQRDFARAESDLRAARWLNPDAAPDISRAFALQGAGRHREAADVLEQVVRREPDNGLAWRVLAVFARELDRPTARRAEAQLDRLDPLNAALRQ
jgi:predicted Zn-dependent protease